MRRAATREASADLRVRVRKLDAVMGKAQDAIRKLDAMIVDAAGRGDGRKVASLSTKRAEFERRLVEIEEEWLEASAALEA